MSLWPFHHRKKTNIASVSQQLQGVQLQSAAPAIAIPISYGQARLAGNLIHYKDLVGGTVENLLISLTHAVIVMGICEGPIADIIHVWYDKQSRTVTGAGGLTVFLGTLSQAAWSFLTANFPSEAVPYELTAYVASSIWPLKEGASLPNFNWEVRGFLQWNYPTIPDSNPKDVVTDFLTDPNHGALFPSAQLGNLTAFRDYCTAAGIFLSPVYTAQQSAAQHMMELLALANSAFVWSDGLLKIVPYGDTAITGNGVTYTPNVTPVYNLTDDDFMVASPGDDPVRVTRKPQADSYNHIQLQFENRAKDYNIDIAEYKDQTSIELTQLRTAPVMNAPQIKDAQVARNVVQLAGQRQVYIRNTYEFELGLKYVLLEPMDLVTLTDANLGLNQTPARLIKIEEQSDGTFLCTAEEWPFGVATAALYPIDTNVGYAPNIPSSPNPPGIWVSFDATGQAILNLSGDRKTVEHIYVLRTDRLPTLAETRAGTVANVQTPGSIATGVVVAPGASVYIGDLTYNTWGDESALVAVPFLRGGAIALSIRARVTATTPTTMTVRVALADPNPQGAGSGTIAYQDLGSGGVTPASGGTVAPAATITEAAGTFIDYTVTRPAFGAGTGRVTFSGSAANRSTAFDAVEVPEVGRDTVSLLVRARILSQTGFVAVVRVAVADPYPQGANSATITFFEAGVGAATTPASGQTVTPAATLTEAAGTFVDFTITRQTSSKDSARVTFTATAAGRTDHTASVDVQISFPGQGSIIPATTAKNPFLFDSGGPATTQMWIAWSWSAVTVNKPDGTTISVPSSASMGSLAAPTLSQVAGGALGARTRFARIALVKNGMFYQFSAESSFAISASNLLKITSPGAVSGFDGWTVFVGSASNTEFEQIGTIAFGTDYTEISTGFTSTTTPYNNAKMQNAVVSTGFSPSPAGPFYFYPWWELATSLVGIISGGTAPNVVGAAAQNQDGRIPLSAFTAMAATTPTAGLTSSGNGGGGKYL
jgi:hypothetical protein